MTLDSERLAYVCQACGASGVKLWRYYQTFLENQRLLCRRCAEADQANELEGDQIGWMVPAVPTEDGTTFWGYTSVPKDRVEWWKALPLRIRETAAEMPEAPHA